MQLRITESEVRQAIVCWLKEKHGLEIEDTKLVPQYEVHGQYEETTKVADGYVVEDIQLL